MSSRDKILARIAAARSDSRSDIEIEIRRHARGPMPPVADDLAARFCEQARKLSSDVQAVEDQARVPSAVADYLRAHRLPPRAVCWPALAPLDWAAAGLEVEARPARPDDLVGISGVFAGIAETGTLMLLSGPQTPATTSLLPETHVAVLAATDLVANQEQAWDRLRAAHGLPPRAINLVSGPSRTADIEQTVTLGAHGPYRVLILLVG